MSFKNQKQFVYLYSQFCELVVFKGFQMVWKWFELVLKVTLAINKYTACLMYDGKNVSYVTR